MKCARRLEDDAVAVRRTLSGDREGFVPLVDRYHKPLYGHLLGRVGDPAAAEDLTQEAFLRAYRLLPRCTDPAGFSSWLFAIADRCRLEWISKAGISKENLRRGNRWNPPGSPSERPEERVARMELREALQRRIDTLPDPMQVVLRLRYQSDLPVERIAEILGKPKGTITSLLSRAYARIRRELLNPIREGHKP